MTTSPNRAGAVLMALIGVIHLVLAPEYLEEQAYVGVLFIVGGIVALALAARIWRAPTALDWALGAAIAAGMAVGFVLSRTIGLPGFHEADWELSGIISVLLEAAFVGVGVSANRGELEERGASSA